MLAMFATLTAQAQKPSIGQVIGERVPQFCGSTGSSGADSTRLPIMFQARITGLNPGARYKYFARFISLADTASSTTTGAGIPVVVRQNGTWATISSPDISNAGGHDTISLPLGMGDYLGWFGAIYTNDARFTPGSYIYPMIVIEEIGTGTPMTMKYYINDSIKVLAFSQAGNSNSGTAIYGNSFAPGKSIVALYDDVNGMTNRPISISYAESESLSFSNMPYWYSNKVNGTSGAWGAIIPNDLSSGIQRIESRDPGFDTIIFANKENDAIWGNDSTMDRRGGAKRAVVIKSEYAPLVKPEFEFTVNTTNIIESNAIVKAVVRRRYGNADSSKVSAFVTAGTATNGVDYSILSTFPFTFKPYGEATDTIRVRIFDDFASEPTENVAIRLNNPVNAKVGFQTTHSINITDNDLPVVTFAKKSAIAKENGGILKVKLRINNGSSSATNVRVAVKTKSDSTFIPMDFKMGSNNVDTTVRFPGNKVIDSLEFNVYLQNDTRSEDRNDTVVLVLRNPTSPATVGADSLMTLIIEDDDAPSLFRFANNKITVSEGVGSVKLRINRTLGNIFQSDIILSYDNDPKNAQAGSDFMFSPQLLSFDASDPDSLIINVPIINDNMSELREDAVFVIRNSFNARIARPDTFRVTIIDNDLPEYKIVKINTAKSPNFILDSLNVHCVLRGVVYGVNMGPTPNGTSFTLMDNTGGIQVINTSSAKGYTVTEGDSVQVYGRIAQVNGMSAISSLDTIIKLGSGRTLKNAKVVTAVAESTESDLVKFNLVKLANPAEWPSAAMAPNTTANVTIQTASGTFTAVIDSETDIDGKPAPTGFFNLTGIGAQIDNSAPYTSGYVLVPRRMADFNNLIVPVFSFTTTTSTSKENRDSTEAFTLQCANITAPQQIELFIKGGTAARNTDYQSNASRLFILSPSNPSVVVKSKINDDLTPELNETIIWVIKNNPWGTLIGADSVHTVTIIDDETNSIDDIGLSAQIKLYPNPASGMVNLKSAEAMIQSVEITDLNGRVIMHTEGVDALETRLNIEGLSKGMYNVTLTTDKGIARKILSVL